MIFRMSWLDWKLGGRMLVKYPGLTLIGGLTLALAIGLGAGWFEITSQILHPRLPLDEGDRIIRIDNWDAAASEVEARSLYDFQLWREQLTTVRELGAYRSFQRNLILPDGNAYPVSVAEISPSAFALARVPPALGRTLIEADAEPGASDVIVIGYAVWQSRFNGESSVISRRVQVGRTSATIVGVMPEGFGFPVSHQVWIPLRVSNTAARGGPEVRVFGRLADGSTMESAQAEVSVIGQRIAAANPTTHAQLEPRVSPIAGPATGREEARLLRFSHIIAWLILAAACVNVATLVFARTASREAEIVVRNAIGASRSRVMMQLFIEALALCLVAALVGLTAASLAIEPVVRMFLASEQSAQLPFWWEFTIRPSTILYAAALAVSGAALVSLLPAIKATGPRVHSALTMASSGRTGMQFGGVWSFMIVLQVATAALCLPLGVFAVFWTLNDRVSRSGYPMHEYVTFQPELDRDAAITASRESSESDFRAHLSDTYAELKRRLEREPSVAAVTFGTALPGLYHPLRQLELQRGSETPVLIDANIESDLVRTTAVAIDYFEAFRVPVIAGRTFHAADVATGNVAIINETLARNIGGNPIGVRIRYAVQSMARRDEQAASPWYEVVGVVRNTLGSPPEPGRTTGANPGSDQVFLPASVADAAPLYVAVHTRGDATTLVPRLRALAAQVEPGLRLYDLLPLSEVVRRRERPEIQGMFVALGVTVLVLGLSAAGLYSLMSVAVTRRRREIGIRLAIGANPRAVISALFARAVTQIGVGIGIASVLLPLFMSSIGISELPLPFVITTILIASGGMLLTGLVACGLPARDALRIQPSEAVKSSA